MGETRQGKGSLVSGIQELTVPLYNQPLESRFAPISWLLSTTMAWTVETDGESSSISSRVFARAAKKSGSDFGNVTKLGWYRASKAAPRAHLEKENSHQ